VHDAGRELPGGKNGTPVGQIDDDCGEGGIEQQVMPADPGAELQSYPLGHCPALTVHDMGKVAPPGTKG
jgi:hypothetical protein